MQLSGGHVSHLCYAGVCFVISVENVVEDIKQLTASESKTTQRLSKKKISTNLEFKQVLKMVEDAIFAAHQMEQLLYCGVVGRIPVRLFTDSESTLESVASSKQVVTKTLRMTIVDLKERLI